MTAHSARKGTVDAANKLLECSRSASSGTGTLFLRDPAQLQRLSAAAATVHNKSLATVLRGGVAFHHSGMEPEDRELVERLFRAQDVRVRGCCGMAVGARLVTQALCATSSLAMGVNLPARLVVIKGTRRYADAVPGTAQESGYREYEQSICLQMMGRAGMHAVQVATQHAVNPHNRAPAV